LCEGEREREGGRVRVCMRHLNTVKKPKFDLVSAFKLSIEISSERFSSATHSKSQSEDESPDDNIPPPLSKPDEGIQLDLDKRRMRRNAEKDGKEVCV
jgi:hypothetical protein